MHLLHGLQRGGTQGVLRTCIGASRSTARGPALGYLSLKMGGAAVREALLLDDFLTVADGERAADQDTWERLRRSLAENPPHYVDLNPLPRQPRLLPDPPPEPKMVGGYTSRLQALRGMRQRWRAYLQKLEKDNRGEESSKGGFARFCGINRITEWRIRSHWHLPYPYDTFDAEDPEAS